MGGSMFTITVMLIITVLCAFFGSKLIGGSAIDEKAFGGALLIMCVIAGAVLLAMIAYKQSQDQTAISQTQVEYIDYDKIDIQVIKVNDKVIEITYTYGGETIHLPIKEDTND